MRNTNRVRVAAMAVLVAAAVVVGAGQAGAEVRRYPVDGGGSGNGQHSIQSLKKPHRGAQSMADALRSIFVRYWDADGDATALNPTQRMPVVRGPRLF
ncbi:MAG TPA: hypothetical protein VGK89_05500 [Candidatus Eisenbacteria bacterium]|jgi:hypothetical protein